MNVARLPIVLRMRPLVAALLLVSAAVSAFADALILSDGRRVPCRILSRTDTHVTVRNANGDEITYPLQEVARIDDSVSAIEIYEAVAESTSPRSGALAYYLGLWVTERLDARKDDARILLGLAAQDPSWRARVMYQLSKTAETEAAAADFLVESLTADPTCPEVVEAMHNAKREYGEIPQDVLMKLVSCIDLAIAGSYGRAASKLKLLEAWPDKTATEALSARLRDMTGLSLAGLCIRCEGAAQASLDSPEQVETPVTTQGDDYCEVCNGSGYVTCDSCIGQGFTMCETCGGKGSIKYTVRNSRGGKRTEWKTCQGCAGAGIKDCSVCLRNKSGVVSKRTSLSVSSVCSRCDGTGLEHVTRTRRSSTLLGRSSASTYDSTRSCPDCRGTGSISRFVPIDRRYSGTGTRRCMKCNGEGKKPQRRGGRSSAARTSRSYASDVWTIRTPSELFGEAGVTRLRRFAQLARQTGTRQGQAQWGCGAAIPAYRAMPAIPLGEVLIFACGKWRSPQDAETAVKRSKALMQNPRDVDFAEFSSWLDGRELEHLRRVCRPIGEGRGAAGEILGLADLYSRHQEFGKIPSFDANQVFRTAFAPGGASDDSESICTWTLHGGGASARIDLVMFSRPTAWPATLVSARTEPGRQLDLSGVATDMASDARLQSLPLTIYYRITGCSRSVTDEGLDAKIRTAFGIEPLAVTAGSGATAKVWTVGSAELQGRK